MPSVVQLLPYSAQLAHVPVVPLPLQVSPRQQPVELWLGSQVPPSVLQLLQEQLAVEVVPHAAPFDSMQVIPAGVVQHASPGTQAANWALQVGGTAQTPERHCSVGALQQGFVVEQDVPVDAQVFTGWQTPLVAVGGSLKQLSPEQHSSRVQEPPLETHGGAQTPPVQLLEQHSLAEAQVCPFSWQLRGTSQVKADAPSNVQTVPAQQLGSSEPVQAACSAVQVDSVQRSTPSASGTHGAKLQH